MKSVVIPDSVTEIGDFAFANCSGLTSIKISDSVISIGKAAFFNCDSLTSIIIPKGRRGLFKNLDLYDDVMLIEG